MARAIASILEAGMSEAEFQLTAEQRKTFLAITRCRTGALGYLRASCACGYGTEIPCSCRNRHCPQCQHEAARQWRERYQSRLPDLPTYHAVFTVPDALRYFFRARPREMFRLLFQSVQQALQHFTEHDRRLQGAKLGYIAVLHTWGDQLQFHPHLHLLISGGGFTAKGQWKSIDPQRGYLFPQEAAE